MKVVFLSINYWQGFCYQDNELAKATSENGHDVAVVAPNRVHKKYSYLASIDDTLMKTADSMDGNVRVIRLPVYSISPYFYVMPKLRKVLKALKPDVLYVHSPQQLQLITAAKYAKTRPNMPFFVDNHADCGNSATNWLSKNVLHKIIYRVVFQYAKSRIDKVLCTSPLRLEFMKEMYKAPSELLEVFRMGGTVLADDEREALRAELRAKHNIKDDDILLLHAGKLSKIKKTIEMLKVFSQVPDASLKLIIAGSVSDDIASDFSKYADTDERIQYIGWLSGDELDRLYCAADIYLQPGFHSVNVENSICKGCAVIATSYGNQQKTVSSDNGWIINDVDEISGILCEIVNNRSALMSKRKYSLTFAKENLDYKQLAKRYTDGV